MTQKHNIIICALIFALIAVPVSAQQRRVVQYNASDLIPKTNIVVTPASATFEEGSTFDVPIFVNTRQNNVNAIDLQISFTPNTLSVVRPSGGKSIIGLWVEPPTYDNTKGTVKIVGAIPGGITSDSGLIVTVTFKAKASGQAVVSIKDTTQVLLSDGAGTPTTVQSSRAVYSIVPKPPGGVSVFSDTHPFQDRWYNNSSPSLGWDKDAGVSGFSYVLDDKPNTIPGNSLLASTTGVAYENISDGLMYFHIKQRKAGVWGSTTNYILRIDTAPPAAFKPEVNYISASVINRFLISFFTTDSLSGIDHYEVGVINKSAPASESPVFVETESPYQLPFSAMNNARVIVRAFDKAGNLRDASIDVEAPIVPLQWVKDRINLILIGFLSLIILGTIIHFFYGHHIIRRFRKAMQAMKGGK